MPTLDARISSADRKIQMLFIEIESNLDELRELIQKRANRKSSLCWFSFYKKTESHLNSLFSSIYKAEVDYRIQFEEEANNQKFHF